MSWETDLRNELTALVDTTWPNLVLIQRERTAARTNWRALLEAADKGTIANFGVPFAVIEFGAANPSGEWGDQNDAYEMQVAIFYITRQQDTSGVPVTETTLENTLIARAQAMQTALEANSVVNWQCLGSSRDRSAAIPPNAFFLKAKIDLYAVQVTATLICGQQR